MLKYASENGQIFLELDLFGNHAWTALQILHRRDPIHAAEPDRCLFGRYWSPRGYDGSVGLCGLLAATNHFWREQIEKFKQETEDMIQGNLSADELNDLLLSLG